MNCPFLVRDPALTDKCWLERKGCFIQETSNLGRRQTCIQLPRFCSTKKTFKGRKRKLTVIWGWDQPLLGFPGGSDRKESACSARDPDSIPGSGRSLEKEMATHCSILAWRIAWTVEPGGLQSWDHRELDTTEQLSTALIHTKYVFSLWPLQTVL